MGLPSVQTLGSSSSPAPRRSAFLSTLQEEGPADSEELAGSLEALKAAALSYGRGSSPSKTQFSINPASHLSAILRSSGLGVDLGKRCKGTSLSSWGEGHTQAALLTG